MKERCVRVEDIWERENHVKLRQRTPQGLIRRRNTDEKGRSCIALANACIFKRDRTFRLDHAEGTFHGHVAPLMLGMQQTPPPARAWSFLDKYFIESKTYILGAGQEVQPARRYNGACTALNKDMENAEAK